MSELASIQKWFTSILIKSGGLEDRITAADKFYGLNSEQVVVASQNMTVDAKIAIYANGYLTRLMECIEAEYPALRRLVGDELFYFFAHGYLMHIPSQSPDLYDLGRHFADFLSSTQPKIEDEANKAMFNLPIELARTERALAEVARSRGTEHFVQNDFTAQHQLLSLFQKVYLSSPCLQLLELQFPVIEFIRAAKADKTIDQPAERNNYLAISRKHYVVLMHELEAWQWHFLVAMKSSDDYMAAVAKAAIACNLSEAALLADLMMWMPIALDRGYLYVA